MKKFLFLHLLIFSLYGEIPSWYLENNEGEKGIIYGKGEGKTLHEAKANARRDISTQINVSLQSSTHFSHDSSGKREGNIVIKEESDTVLNDVRVVKEGLSEGVWYVLLQSDTRPLETRIIAKKGVLCTLPSSGTVTFSPFIASLNSTLGCTPPWKIARDNQLGRWLLTAGEESFRVAIDNFFMTRVDEKIALKSSKTDLNHAETFHLSITPHTQGFVSLITVEANGQVHLLEQKKATPNRTFTFPDDNNELTSEILEGKSTKDWYIALLTPVPLAHDFFPAPEALIKDESRQSFDKLTALLEKYPFSSVVIRTTRK